MSPWHQLKLRTERPVHVQSTTQPGDGLQCSPVTWDHVQLLPLLPGSSGVTPGDNTATCTTAGISLCNQTVPRRGQNQQEKGVLTDSRAGCSLCAPWSSPRCTQTLRARFPQVQEGKSSLKSLEIVGRRQGCSSNNFLFKKVMNEHKDLAMEQVSTYLGLSLLSLKS